MKNTAFVCQNCGHQSPRWLGRCPGCGEWNSFVEEERVTRAKPKRRQAVVPENRRPVRLSDVAASSCERRSTGIGELDRVLGGGLVPGSLILIGGEPGIGKSTLTLQVCDRQAAAGAGVLYVSGEESAEQLRIRAARLGIKGDSISVLCTVGLEDIVEAAQSLQPGLLVVDSIQTVFSSTLSSAPGSVSQVRECTAELLRLAKARQMTTVLVGHVTKFGAIAGPKTLEHMVDTVLSFEGERFQQYRLIRAAKNRFGSTNEVGVFEMADTGLVEVTNPSRFFLSDRRENVSGSAVAATLEGTRPLLVEIQALAAKTPYALPQRVANGFDTRRLSMLLCVLERRAGVNTSGQDVFLNVAGGLRIQEPAADLGVVAAVASSVRDAAVRPDCVLIGEVGLGGEVRSVSRAADRLKEAARLGFGSAILPRRNLSKKLDAGVEVFPADTVRQALEILEVVR